MTGLNNVSVNGNQERGLIYRSMTDDESYSVLGDLWENI